VAHVPYHVTDLANEIPGDAGDSNVPDPNLVDIPPEDTDPVTFNSDARSIYIPADQLNIRPFRTPPSISIDIAGANSIIPYAWGRTRIVALPFKVAPNVTNTIFLLRVCKGEIDGFEKLIINGNEIDISARPLETEFFQTIFGAVARIILFSGNSTQNVSTWAALHIPLYTDDLQGQCVIGLRLASVTMPSSLRIELVLRGLRVYDPRSLTTSYSNNPSLILRDIVLNRMGRPVDEQSFIDSANANDEDVDPPNNVKRRTCGFAVDRPGNVKALVAKVQALAGVMLVDTGNLVFAIPNRPASSVMTIDGSLLIGPMRERSISRKDIPVNTTVAFYDPDSNINKFASALPGGSLGRNSEVQMPGIQNYEQAHREAVERQNHNNLEQSIYEWMMRDEGAQLEPGDIVTLTDARIGLSAKQARVMQVSSRSIGRWSIVAREYDPLVYSDSIQTDPSSYDTNLPDPTTIPTPAAPTLVEVFEFVNPDRLRFRVRIDEPDFAFTRAFVFEIWDQAGTKMIISPIILALAAMTEIAVGPPRSLEAVFEVPLEFQFKVRVAIQNTFDQFGSFSPFTSRVFASGFEDPENVPTPLNYSRVSEFIESTTGRVDHIMTVYWEDPTLYTPPYVYPTNAIVKYEHDNGTAGATWTTIETLVVPASEENAVFGRSYDAYKRNNVPIESPALQFRVDLSFRSVFEGVGTSVIINDGNLLHASDPIPPAPIHLRFEQLPEPNQARLHFGIQGDLNYIAGIRMLMFNTTDSVTVGYYDVPDASWINPEYRNPTSPAIINMSGMEEGNPVLDPVETFPKSFDFQSGINWTIQLHLVNRNGGASASALIAITWDNLITGGLTSAN